MYSSEIMLPESSHSELHIGLGVGLEPDGQYDMYYFMMPKLS